MDRSKLHKGKLEAWEKVLKPPFGYYFVGKFVGHPIFDGKQGHTSLVVFHSGNEVETLNSRYTLGKSLKETL